MSYRPRDRSTSVGKISFGTLPLSLATTNRWDVAVKWRLFQHFLDGDDPDAIGVYLWHIERRMKDLKDLGFLHKYKGADSTLLSNARELFDRMRLNGFDSQAPILIDPNGVILDGAHRTACAIALGLGVVVIRIGVYSTAPDWGCRWFEDRGMPEGDLAILKFIWSWLHAGSPDKKWLQVWKNWQDLR